MVFSRDAAIYGAPMRPDLPPLSSAKNALRDGADGHHVAIELALPATILAFIIIAEQSPMLKVELDNVLDWFVKNDFYFWSLTAIILALPLRMIVIMLTERMKSQSKSSAPFDSSQSTNSPNSDSTFGAAV